MKKNLIITGISSFILGIIVTVLIVFFSSPSLMITEDKSMYSFEETVQKILASAEANGWKVPAMHEIDKSVKKAGFNALPVTVIELCHQKLAGEILQDDAAKVVTSMMPCRLSIYQTKDGTVTVSRMNTGLVSKMFGGIVTKVMADATKQSEKIVSVVLK
jgi:uncharacterized protein (DUF302 family)